MTRITAVLVCIICIFSKNSFCQSSENGYLIPIEGEVKVLLVWARVVDAFTIPASVSGYGKGVLPMDADDFFDPSFTPGVEPTAYITKYFYEQSFGKYIVTGDYLDHVLEVTDSLQGGYAQIYSYLNALGSIQSNLQHNSQISDFDKYTINNTNNYFIKPNVFDSKYDVVIILWSDHYLFRTGGHGMHLSYFTNSTIGTQTGVNADCAFGGFTGLNTKKFIIQEYFHGMFGGNDWHTGAGASDNGHTFMTFTNPWGVPSQLNGAGISNVANGWDRFHLGWYGWLDKNQTIQKTELISALDQSGAELTTDFTIQSNVGNGIFVLRDFVKYGDAVRIKLPHLQDDPLHPIAKNQYLWIENHQRLTTFDHGQHEDLPQEEPGQTCKDPTLPGMWAFIQVGKDNKGPGNIYGSGITSSNALASFIFPLTAEGNFDFKYADLTEAAWIDCLWNNKSVAIDKSDPSTLPNPFIGYSDIFNFYNSNGNNILSKSGGDSYQPGASEKVNGIVKFNQHARGDHEDAFNFLTGKTKISLSSNPAPTPVYTYRGSGVLTSPSASNQHLQSYENRSIWLNGISIEILQENYDPTNFGPGAILVKIKMDEYEVNQPVRWCGNIKVSPNDFDPTPSDFTDNMYALNVVPGGSILLDRSRSYTRHYAVDQNPATNEYRFSEPTEMTILPNAYFHMEGGTNMVVDGESTLRVKGNSRLEVHEFGSITVKKGSKLIIESNAQVVLWDNAFIKVEQGGILEYDNSSIELLGNNSVIEFEGTLSIADNADFTFTGDGYVKFSQQGWINPTTNPSNLVIGTGATITLVGTSPTDKVLEVTQESLYAFNPLVKFTLNNGLAALGNDSRICVEGDLDLLNATITSTTGANNLHRGFNIFGQPNVFISNCTFEYGNYGLYSLLTFGGNPLTLANCNFQFNNIGLVTVDKGVTLNNCDFNENGWGWEANGMTFPSTVKTSNFNSNSVAGINYFGGGSSSLFLKNSSVNLNQFNGIEYHSPSLLTVSCGSVFDNYNYGIYLTNNAILNTSPLVSPYGGKVNLTNNNIGIFADCANNWLTVGGRNNFTSDFQVARGKFNLPCTYTIPANFNRWKTTLTSPSFNVNYTLDGCACPPNNHITLNDPSPINQLLCAIIWNPTPSQKNQIRLNNPIEHCPGCEKITTAYFNDVKINEAVETSLGYLEFGKDSLTGVENDLLAIDLFSQILTYRYNQGNKFNFGVSEGEGWLLELSNQKMKEALSNAYLNNKLTGITNPEVEKVLTALDSVYVRELLHGKFEKAFYAIMDKASVYNLVGNRQQALYELNNMATCIPMDSVQQSYLTKLTNTIYAEELLMTGKLKKEDFEKYLKQLYLGNQMVSGFEISNSPNDSLFANVYFVGDTIDFQTTLPSDNVSWDFGDCSAATGQSVQHIFNSPGKYMVNCNVSSSCNSSVHSSEIIILPAFEFELSDSLLRSSCTNDDFLVEGILLSEISSPSCSTNFNAIDTSLIRYRVYWDFDLFSQHDSIVYFSYSDAINNSLGDFTLSVFKGDTSKVKATIIPQYYTNGNWKNTNKELNINHNLIAGPSFYATIEFDSLACQLDSTKFQAFINGGETPYRYEWAFDGEIVSQLAEPSVVFKEGGEHHLSVLISDHNGCIANINFPQGSAHQHFDFSDSTAHEELNSEFDFTTQVCPTIFGYLSSYDPCYPLDLSNVNLELINQNRQSPISLAVTDNFGRFQFKPSEVATLDSTLELILTIKRPREYYLTESINGLPATLISHSPIQVFINSTEIDTIKRSNSGPFETAHVTQIIDNDGNKYSISTVNSVSANTNFLIEKRDNTNALIWDKTIDYAFSRDSVTSFCIDSSGNAYIVGTTWNGIDNDIFIVKVDAFGNQEWYCTYEDSVGVDDRPLHICLDSNERVCISAVNLTQTSISYSNIFYKQCLESASRNSTSTWQEQIKIVEPKEVFTIYPNPNSSQNLFVNRISGPDAPRIIKIYNLNGQLIYSSSLKNGLNDLSIELKSGIYPCIFSDESGKIIQVEKLVKINE